MALIEHSLNSPVSKMDQVADSSLIVTVSNKRSSLTNLPESKPLPPEQRNNLHNITAKFWSVPCILMTGICFVVSPIMVGIGIVYIEQCPKQPYIPIFLVVAGALTILSSTVNIFIQKLFSTGTVPEKNVSDRGLIAVTNLLHGITFSWYIAGCIWIYGAFQPEYNFQPEMKSVYCNRNLYLFAFWLMSSAFIVIGVAFVFGCTILTLGILCSKK